MEHTDTPSHSATPLADPTTGRHYGMDWLRIAAFAMLIFYHVGMGFVPWDWHVKWTGISETLRLPMLAMNGWRLSLLFVVSGYASAALFAKMTPGAFLRSRSARLLIPLVFGAVLIIPPQVWIDLMFNHGYARGYLAFWGSDYFRFGALGGIIMPTWQHLWFVVYLFAYTLALIGLHLLLGARGRALAAKAGSLLLGGPLLLLVPVAWIVARYTLVFPGLSDTHALVDDFAAHWIFLPMFLFGVLLRYSATLWTTIRQWWAGLALSALASTAAMLLIAWHMTGNPDWPMWLEIGYTALRSTQSWLVILALIGLSDRFWNRDHASRAMLNEAVFPFYIIHQTIIVAFIWYLRPLAMPIAMAFVLTMLVTTLGCCLFYRIGREVPVLRVLIGLRGWRVPPAPKPAAINLPAATG
ncbi:acyltransferase family protein [Parerythrobacter aestuarii]|uniref:acyltransferase family protein n=1 Tax=Parerythrobacter aestuarii TaxID=3020909 RepID=UPI0024DEF711|nr:acyltransferase family protein [Parerythrobacter aestuarii]